MDKLRAMQVFVTVVDTGSFAAAAQALELSAVMVGKHIQALERQLGARLLDRTTRRQHLTEFGSAYVERCRDVLASVRAADGVADALRATPEGLLRVTAPVTYGAYRVAPIVAAYLAAHAGVRVDLHLNDRVVDLVQEGFDCGIRSGPLADDSLIARPLSLARMLAVASPSWVTRHGLPRHPSELEGLPLLGFAVWGRDHHWRFRRGDEWVQVPVRGPLTANNGQALLNAAVAGLGVAVQTDALLLPALEAGQLVQLLPDWELPTRPIHIVRPPQARPSAKVRTFVDYVVQQLG